MQSIFRVFLFWTLVTGLAYPALVTGVSQLAFPYQANGSFDGRNCALLNFAPPAKGRFWARPSACNNAPESAAATQLGPTSTVLKGQIEERRRAYPEAQVPTDFLTSSGSGLDPDISVASARLQIPRVARESGLSPEQLEQLVRRATHSPQFGVLGSERVSIPELNAALESGR